MLPGPVEAFLPASDGGDREKPDLFVYDDPSKAERASRALPGETRVETEKIDGRQWSVIEERVNATTAPGIGRVETWVTKPIAPSPDDGEGGGS